jgi:cytochrome c oxidase subunit II
MRIPTSLRLCVCLSALVGASCSGQQNFMSPEGPAAAALARLGWFAMVIFMAAIAATLVILVWATYRRTGTLEEHAPADAGGGQGWILLGGLLIPGVVFVAIFVATLQTMSAFPMGHEEHDSPDIRVVGRQWWWDAEYEMGDLWQRVHVPTEIHIPVGRPIDIALESRDVIHSFWVPKLHGKVDLVPGQVNRIRIEASEPGVYRGECAEFCGEQHAHMVFTVVAESDSAFQSWLAHQRQPAPAPALPATIQGRDLFMSNACVTCHTIRGTQALATVGPDLTHIGSRRLIAGGMLENNVSNLHAWVTHAQAIKPGVAMPNMTAFNGEELRALVSYLETLN